MNSSVVVVREDRIGVGRLSADGRLPRVASSADRERRDAAFRSRMQEARQALGEEMFSDSPDSLAKLRLARGYSQQQLALAMGTSQPAIAKMEAGVGDLMFSTATRLADALGVKLDELRPLLQRAAQAEKHE